jgi:HEAT repeat protein
MNSCPTCGKPVDPLRAPAAKIKAGKVVAYCSKECSAAADTAPVTKPVVAPEPAPAPAKPVAATKPAKRTPPAGVPKTARDLDSGPVIEIVREPATGVVTSAADARIEDVVPARHSITDGAIEIADTGHVDDYVDVDPPVRHTARLVLLLLVLALAAGVFAAYQMGYLDQYLGSAHGETAKAPPPRHVEPPPPPPPPAVTAAEALDRAREVLRKQVTSATPRVQRVSAEALARTGDVDALAKLATAGKEDSDLAKIEIGYALMRAGDKRGEPVLVAALGSQRRDVKLEAGRRLAQLGDKRAVATLGEYLEVSQLRLGAAEALAYLAEPRAIDVLDKIRKDEHSSPDYRARATRALAVAGRPEVAEELRGQLADTLENAFAAAALAALHDPAARPVLVAQLAMPTLRVPAARALRRLEPQLDPDPLLPGLLDALASPKDTEQVEAAEAILLVAGPANWSERE